MRAIVHDRYGTVDDLELREIERPQVDADTVLVRARAAAVNPLDWYILRGDPLIVRLSQGLLKPKFKVRGLDVAGVVEATGANITQFKPGDEVFGSCRGAFAEYALGRERNFAHKPHGLSFEQAAAVPTAGFTALQALRDAGELQPGQRVLINGASGGVGTFAVQIARALGAEVTGVCSTRNLEAVLSLGAAHVIDYTREDFSRSEQKYDLILDAVGNRSLPDLRRALAPNGTLVLVGGAGGRLLGALGLMLRAAVVSRFVGQKLRPFLAQPRKADLLALAELIEAGNLTPVVGRTYALAETAEAIRYVETGHAQGKTVITIGE